MTSKEPVLLIVLIDTARRAWHVAGGQKDGHSVPLMRSEVGNLDSYVGLPFDEQVSFLHRRLSGVLQRGCDRLWGRSMKAFQIVFVIDGRFTEAEPELTQGVADHFVTWMTRPPVVFLEICRDRAGRYECLAGEFEPEAETALVSCLPALMVASQDESLWELSHSKPKRQ